MIEDFFDELSSENFQITIQQQKKKEKKKKKKKKVRIQKKKEIWPRDWVQNLGKLQCTISLCPIITK